MIEHHQSSPSPSQGVDLLYGVPAIARFLGLKPGAVWHRVNSGQIPTFRIGGTICSTRSAVTAWINGQMEAANGHRG